MIKNRARKGEHVLLMVYCATHGLVFDNSQYLILNDTNNNLFSIEQEIMKLCIESRIEIMSRCTVISIYDTGIKSFQ